ncbi:MAG: hypothetical protein ACI9PN_002042 [Candidatus Azotimanducaceae bacterium]|jgi:hypothetical protein
MASVVAKNLAEIDRRPLRQGHRLKIPLHYVLTKRT